MDIKRLMDIGCYRGLRHRRSLPVRANVRIQMLGRERARGKRQSLRRRHRARSKLAETCGSFALNSKLTTATDHRQLFYGSTKEKGLQKEERKNIPYGIVHIAASFNNTMISITDTNGNLVASRHPEHAVFGVPERAHRSLLSRPRARLLGKLRMPGCVRSRSA